MSISILFLICECQIVNFIIICCVLNTDLRTKKQATFCIVFVLRGDIIMGQMKIFSYDDETGEVITCDVNDETGETDLENRTPLFVPERYYDNNLPTATLEREQPTKIYTKFPKHGYMCKTKKFQKLKDNIMAGSNMVSHRLLLLPTLMICPAAICVLLAILEVYLHMRCHKKNKCLKDSQLYYRSPFHVLSSIFCGVCRETESASKVGMLQDKRRIRYDYLKGMAI